MMDFNSAEIPRERRLQQLAGDMSFLVGSVTSTLLHKSYSVRGDHSVDRSKIHEVQRDKLDFIRKNYPPDEVVASLMQYPPKVFVDIGEDDSVKPAVVDPKGPIRNIDPLVLTCIEPIKQPA